MKHMWKKGIVILGMLCLLAALPTDSYAADTMQTTIRAVSSDKLELKWTALEEAARYVIYRKSSSEGSFHKITATDKTIYRDSNITAAVTYYYKIVPVGRANGKEIKSAQTTLKAKTPQKVPIEKIKVKSPTKMQLYWNPSTGSNGYQIFRAESKGGSYTQIGEVEGQKSCGYTDSAVVPGKTYYYRIRPTSQGELGVGTFSAPVKGRTIGKTSITSIMSVTSDQMRITWKKVSNATSYEVYRSTSATGNFKRIATVKGSVKKYTDRTVKSGKKYHYKIVAVGNLEGVRISSGYSQTATFRTLRQPEISSIRATSEDGLKVKWGRVSGATKYKIYRATSKLGSYKKIATVRAVNGNILTYEDEKVASGKTYYYKVQAYSDKEGIISAGCGSKSVAVAGTTAYKIMGETTVTAEQMADFFNASGKKFPSKIYKSKGAKNLEKFCEIVLEESEAEGVKAEVIFAQICLETGYLQFGGQVSAQQCNFAGLGATDDGAAGATFKNVSTGIRAQVQHLKGYASTEDLEQECVDPRFVYLTSKRGTARYVQSLGGGNWATDQDYATKLMKMIREMKTY